MGYGVCSIIFYTVLTFFSPSQKHVTSLTKFTMVENMFLMSIFLVWRYFGNTYFTLNVCMSVLYCFLLSMTIVMEEILLLNGLGQLVSTENQSLAEGVRISCSRLGSLTSLLVSPYLFGICLSCNNCDNGYFLLVLHFNDSLYINSKVLIYYYNLFSFSIYLSIYLSIYIFLE